MLGQEYRAAACVQVLQAWLREERRGGRPRAPGLRKAQADLLEEMAGWPVELAAPVVVGYLTELWDRIQARAGSGHESCRVAKTLAVMERAAAVVEAARWSVDTVQDLPPVQRERVLRAALQLPERILELLDGQELRASVLALLSVLERLVETARRAGLGAEAED